MIMQAIKKKIAETIEDLELDWIIEAGIIMLFTWILCY